jgi:pyrroline-5-carboxylate reductase
MSAPFALGVVGTGHIAAVIIKRLVGTGYYAADRIICSPSKALAAHPLSVRVAADAREVVASSRRLLISVTPQKFPDMARSVADLVTAEHLLISVMAGMATDTIAAAFPGVSARVVRTMPNLPFGLGYGVTGVFRGRHASEEDVEHVRHLFNAGGTTVEIRDEALMDAVTAVAGSGPAYFYYFVETMIDAGVAAGLSRSDAQVLAGYACMGAGAMLLDKGASPQELRQAVTSPGGTTEAAMEVLTLGHVAISVKQAVLAAFRRGQELGRRNNPQGR